jgi:hypothetical protein
MMNVRNTSFSIFTRKAVMLLAIKAYVKTLCL